MSTPTPDAMEGLVKMDADVATLLTVDGASRKAKEQALNRILCAKGRELAAALAGEEKLLETIREDLISARIIEAEVKQADLHIWGISRDAKFIMERCEQALARHESRNGGK